MGWDSGGGGNGGFGSLVPAYTPTFALAAWLVVVAVMMVVGWWWWLRNRHGPSSSSWPVLAQAWASQKNQKSFKLHAFFRQEIKTIFP